MKRYMPLEYSKLSKKEKKSICNGCGAKGGIKVPNTMYLLDIEEECNIHDYMYKVGVTYGDKLFADAMFLLNLSSNVLSNSNWFTTGIRLLRATKYFVAVARYGDNAYWVDKEKNDIMTITYKGAFR